MFVRSAPLVLSFFLGTVLCACGPQKPAPAQEKTSASSQAETKSQPSSTPTVPTDSPKNPAFGLYVLALSWSPNFCCSHSKTDQCDAMAGSFAATHLTLHGLWPNYNDEQEKQFHAAYPQFCGDFKRCKNSRDRSCSPDPSSIPADMKKLGPGYVGDNYFLANHEWPKHGSCSGLDAKQYFQAAVDSMKKRPNEGTPDALRNAVGKSISLTELQNSFGIPATSVMLSCDSNCRLEQVELCLGRDEKGNPTDPVPCPSNAKSSQYNNGCVLQKCEQVSVQAAGECSIDGRKRKK